MTLRTLAWGLVLCFTLTTSLAMARSTSTTSEEHALNDGEEFRMGAGELAQLRREAGVGVWRYEGRNWMDAGRPGVLISIQDLLDAHPGHRLHELLGGYRVDIDDDGVPEVVLTTRGPAATEMVHYGLTILQKSAEGWEILYRPDGLPGERFAIEDIRDHDGDGRRELLIAGRAGTVEFYTYFEVVAMDARGVLHRYATVAPDTVHLVDLDGNGTHEFLERRLVSRRAPQPIMWTWVDRVVTWTGDEFMKEPVAFRAYHEEVTKPRLVDELLDFHDADAFLLQTKMAVLRQVHAQAVAARPLELARNNVVAWARRLIKAGKRKRARTALESAIKRDPYRVDALLTLAQMEVWIGRPGRAINLLYQVIGADPDHGGAWELMGVCFALSQERRLSIAAFINSVRLGAESEARRQKLDRLGVLHRSDVVKSAVRSAITQMERTSLGSVHGEEEQVPAQAAPEAPPSP